MKKLLFILCVFYFSTINAQVAGDVVINEFMANPDAETDGIGEYVELYNTTNANIDMAGWVLSDDGSNSHTLTTANGTTIIPAAGYLVLGRDGASTCNPDYDYSGFVLANTSDEIILKNGAGTLICRLDYTDGEPFGAGVSAQLPDNYNYALADDGVVTLGEFIEPNTTYGAGDYGTPGAANILPITLVSFNGELVKSKTELSWTTAQEVNNKYFTLERSNGKKRFTVIGMIDGAGDSDTYQNYSFMDDSPLSGDNFYRLKQTDLDGAFSYSEVIVVRSTSNTSGVNPTLVNDITKIQFEKVLTKDLKFLVLNINGQVIYSGLINKGSFDYKLNAINFNTGTYFVRFKDSSYSALRFVKL